MAHLPIQKVFVSATILGAGMVAASAGGDTFDSHEGVFVHALNESGGDITITIEAVDLEIPTSEGGSRSVVDMVVTVPIAVVEGVFFQVPPAYISGGVVSMVYSSVTDITVGIFEVKHD